MANPLELMHVLGFLQKGRSAPFGSQRLLLSCSPALVSEGAQHREVQREATDRRLSPGQTSVSSLHNFPDVSGSGQHGGSISTNSECVLVPNLSECESSFYGQEGLCGHGLVVHLESWFENMYKD